MVELPGITQVRAVLNSFNKNPYWWTQALGLERPEVPREVAIQPVTPVMDIYRHGAARWSPNIYQGTDATIGGVVPFNPQLMRLLLAWSVTNGSAVVQDMDLRLRQPPGGNAMFIDDFPNVPVNPAQGANPARVLGIPLAVYPGWSVDVLPTPGGGGGAITVTMYVLECPATVLPAYV